MGRELLLDARKTLIEEIRKELMGPGSEFSIPDEQHEIITDLPEVRYSVGILFPQGNLYESDNNDSFTIREVTADIDTEEEEIAASTDEEDEGDFSTGYEGNIAEDTDVSTLMRILACRSKIFLLWGLPFC